MSIELLKKLREETGAGVMDVKRALDQAKGKADKARALLTEWGAARAQKKAERQATEGIIEVYSHNGAIGVLLEVNCETDFVARTEDFKHFAHDLALHIAAMAPESLEALLEQPFVKDEQTTVRALTEALTAKLGEHIKINRFVRYKLGE